LCCTSDIVGTGKSRRVWWARQGEYKCRRGFGRESGSRINIYRTVILPVVLYGCETWSLALREERKLRVFENGVLRIFGPRRVEVTG